MKIPTLFSGLGVALVLAGCGPDLPPEGEEAPPLEGELELGLVSSDGVFRLLSPDEELVLEPGAQGGFHLLLAQRVIGFEPGEKLRVERTTRREDTQQLVTRSSLTTRVSMEAVAPSMDLERRVPLFLCPAPVGISVADRRLEVTVEVEGESGRVAAGSVSLWARCPTASHAELCRSICVRD